MTRAALVALVLLAVTACGGSSKSSAPALSVNQLADKVHCTGYSDSSDEEYVKEGGDCTLGSETLSLDTFANNTSRDSYVKVAQPQGGSYCEGDQWVIHGDDGPAVTNACNLAAGKML